MSIINLIDELDSYYREIGNRPYEKRDPLRFWPTEASAYTRYDGSLQTVGFCTRKLYYRIRGEAESNPVSAGGSRKMTVGKLIENHEILAAEAKGFKVTHNEKFQFTVNDILVSGEVDAIMERDNERFGVEFKTGYGYQFVKNHIGMGSHKGEPKPEHIMQCMMYLHKYRDERINYWILNYIDRGDCHRSQYVITLKPYGGRLESTGDVIEDSFIPNIYPVYPGETVDLPTAVKKGKPLNLPIDEIFRRWKVVKTCIEKGEAPPRDFKLAYTDDEIDFKNRTGQISKAKMTKFNKKSERPGDYNCGYCSYKDICYSAKEIAFGQIGPNTNSEMEE